jgi:hypothetical protein
MTVLCIIAVLSVGTSVCYAASGQGPIQLLQALFEKSDGVAVAQIEDGFVESGESVAFENMKLTLDQYFFDEEEGVILAEMTLQTTDQTPIISWEDAYQEAEKSAEFASEEVDTSQKWEAICREDQEQFQIYREICENLWSTSDSNISLSWPLGDGAGPLEVTMEDETTYHLYQIFIGNKNTEITTPSVLKISYKNEVVGNITLEDTGTMRTRNVDPSVIAGCTNMSLTGAYLQLWLDNSVYGAEGFAQPFENIEITMNNGESYSWADAKDTCIFQYGEDMAIMNMSFPSFVNVDDIVSVRVDGVECLTD